MLVKAYMLETAGSNHQMPDLASRFAGRVHLHRLDHTLVTLTESLSVLEEKLQRLIESYDPLRSLVHLQMPAAGRGGHRLNYDGRVTNRSDSFADHRAAVQRVLALYRSGSWLRLREPGSAASPTNRRWPPASPHDLELPSPC